MGEGRTFFHGEAVVIYIFHPSSFIFHLALVPPHLAPLASHHLPHTSKGAEGDRPRTSCLKGAQRPQSEAPPERSAPRAQRPLAQRPQSAATSSAPLASHHLPHTSKGAEGDRPHTCTSHITPAPRTSHLKGAQRRPQSEATSSAATPERNDLRAPTPERSDL